MTKFHLFSQDSVRLETAPTGVVRKSYFIKVESDIRGIACTYFTLMVDY